MIDSALYHRLAPITRRFQLRKLFITLAIIWTMATMIGLSLWWMKLEGLFYSPLTLPVLCLSIFVVSLTGVWFSLRTRGDGGFGQTAQDIEHCFPELNSSLITAIEQHPAVAHGNLGFLQQEVVRKAVYHGYQHSWSRVVPHWHLLVLPLLAGAGLLAFMISVMGQFMTAIPVSAAIVAGDRDSRVVIPAGGFLIEPGNVEVERYTSLMVLARFANEQLPANAELVYWNENQDETRQEMVKSLDDPVFGTRINSVEEAVQYKIRFDGQESETFQISVFEYPKLKRADAKLEFPDYTTIEDKLIQDVRRVSAVQGTRVTWILTLNKKIQSGRLISAKGQQIDLREDPVEPNRYLAEMTLVNSGRFQLQLTDAQDRNNQSPAELSVQVVGNRPPEIKQIAPGRDVEVSPIEELTLTVSFWDDFGVERAGVSYSMVGKDMKEIELATSIDAKERHEFSHVLPFEELGANPNELLTFYFWAEDKTTTGKLRRTLGDIHMVTVRSFESIFRQGQQPDNQNGAGGQGGNQQGGQPGMELVDLQREIVYAIWNLSRREILDVVSDKFVEDVMVVSDSQTTAIGLLDEQAQMVQDEALKLVVDEIRQYQQETVIQLNEAVELEQAAPLFDAQLSAQLAYQALLRLRSLESEVVQNQQQQGGGGGGGGNRQRQQMQQLELENDENRYESEKTASEREETTEDRENRQVLSRLRELARRQNDLNKRIKELQSALEEAESPRERDEIEDRLKRLREEQQQILRDTEELQDRMERPENQSTMSEQAEQLERARENARQASDALEQGDTTRAAAEGTRALRDMEELRDEFQSRSSGQFDEQMQQMRNEARDIEKDQQQIAKEMEQTDDPSQQQRQSLTDTKPKTDLEERLDYQRERVATLRKEIRDTIEVAEEYEPILAERLYDTYRKSQQESPEEALESTARSLRQGFVEDARREQRRAAQNIEKLREGIDQAAEAVLGDETEALRRANRELQRLANALEGELERAKPDEPSDPADGQQPQPQQGRSTSPDSDQDSPGIGTNDEMETGAVSGGDQPSSDEQPSAEGSQPEPPDSPTDQQGGRGQSDSDSRTRQSDTVNGPPSLRQQNQQDPRGSLGSNPEINYDQDSWDDPIAGDDFVKWSDRMRDVEEMVADPELRAEAARIRENARSIRRDIKRHSKEPNWDLVRLKVIEPLVELQNRVHEELLRRSPDKSLVPVDRDPVPAEFENAVQHYFEQLGRGQ